MRSGYSKPAIRYEERIIMTRENKLTILATGNGDSILIEAFGRRILTDVNYRGEAQDGGNGDCPDIGEVVREACYDDHLDLFVLTHPDADHVRGFDALFHVGPPETHDPDPDDGPAKIVVDEIWCSPYAANPAYTEESKIVVDEIRRRKSLRGTVEGNKPGNRLRILDTAGDVSGVFSPNLNWELLAPTPAEADIPAGDEDCRPSSNGSSLVIRWNVVVDGRDNPILLGGDSTVDIWERIRDDNLNDTPGRLTWQVLVPPHHTSRYTLGRKDENDTFEFSDKAIEGLSGQQGSGWCVSSSKEIKRNDDDPPSWSAKQRYLKILANGGEVDAGVESRFLCTGTHNDGKPGHVVLYLTGRGATLSRGGTRKAAVVSAVARGGSYG